MTSDTVDDEITIKDFTKEIMSTGQYGAQMTFQDNGHTYEVELLVIKVDGERRRL